MSDGPDTLELTVANVYGVLSRVLRSWELDPSPYHGMDEESLRSHLLSAVAGAFDAAVAAEAFRATGKTDFVVSDQASAVLIGECKLYGGVSTIAAALEQLLRNATPRDDDLALIIFVRSRRMSTAQQAMGNLCDHSRYATAVVKRAGAAGEFDIDTVDPGDPGKLRSVWAVLVELPVGTSEGRRRARDVRSVDDAIEQLVKLRQHLPEDIGIDYRTVETPSNTPEADTSAWAVRLTREVEPGRNVGIEARPTDPPAAAAQAPRGRLIADDAASADRLERLLRRADRDYVR